MPLIFSEFKVDAVVFVMPAGYNAGFECCLY